MKTIKFILMSIIMMATVSSCSTVTQDPKLSDKQRESIMLELQRDSVTRVVEYEGNLYIVKNSQITHMVITDYTFCVIFLCIVIVWCVIIFFTIIRY